MWYTDENIHKFVPQMRYLNLSCRKYSLKIIVRFRFWRWYFKVGISSFVFWQLANNNKERGKTKTAKTPGHEIDGIAAKSSGGLFKQAVRGEKVERRCLSCRAWHQQEMLYKVERPTLRWKTQIPCLQKQNQFLKRMPGVSLHLVWLWEFGEMKPNKDLHK